jgi:hypothetical protein
MWEQSRSEPDSCGTTVAIKKVFSEKIDEIFGGFFYQNAITQFVQKFGSKYWF